MFSVLLKLFINKTKAVLVRSKFTQSFLRNWAFFSNPHLRNKFEILKREKITVVLDVGAHIGEFGVDFRLYGYSRKLISFEPMSVAFSRLQKKTKKYSGWECLNYALGNEEVTKEITVLNNSAASSFLEVSDFFSSQYAKMTEKMSAETVSVKKLDGVYSQFCTPSDRVLLKIDVQGFEKQVLEGAEKSLKHISLIQLEVSLVSLYKNEPLMLEMLAFMESKGFTPIFIEPHLPHKKTLFHMQADILFQNKLLS